MTSQSGTARRWPGFPRSHALAVAALLVFPGCDSFGQAMNAHTDVVARAENSELRSQEAAEMLAANPQIPADAEVVRALSELWVDYALLARAVVEDSTLAAVDVEYFIEPVREQTLIGMLRDRVIQVDTVFDDAALARRWETDGPGAEIRASHILLQTPANATNAQRDSVMRFAESLRERAAGGESFADLATNFSQDPGTAVVGGDLGFFGRGRMVQPFEEAAFALEPGQISPVVESPFGFHVILVQERRQPDLGEEREQFRQYLVQEAVRTAEVTYLDSISRAANLSVSQGGNDLVREIATLPARDLSGRQGERTIATYTGGTYTAAEFVTFIRGQAPEVQTAFATATDEQLAAGIEQLVQMKLLLAEAQAQGIAMSAADEEALRSDARAMIRELVEGTGFIEAARVNATPAQVDEHVKILVRGVVTGEQPFIPLGRLGTALRDLYQFEVNDGTFPAVIRQVEETRARQPAPLIPPIGGVPGEPLPIDPSTLPGVTPDVPPAGQD